MGLRLQNRRLRRGGCPTRPVGRRASSIPRWCRVPAADRRRGHGFGLQGGSAGLWPAMHRSLDGRPIRAIVARTAAELAAKLEIAEQAGL